MSEQPSTATTDSRFYGPYMSTDLLTRDGYLAPVQACDECGALVGDADHAKHDAWHEAQNGSPKDGS